jgi:hypothetical protein
MTDESVVQTESSDDKDTSIFAWGICIGLACRTGIPMVVH